MTCMFPQRKPPASVDSGNGRGKKGTSLMGIGDATPQTSVARLVADEATARRVADVFAETYDPAEAAAGAYADKGGWAVAIHFREPPNETAVRALVALAAGADAANALTFETVASDDWVKASLAGLTPVRAGRFVVHGRHDRARVANNAVGLEIEAALAFGTGHHGTTRGCLLALDRLLRSRRPRRVLDIGTGTGVLAIAAAKTLRRRVLAGDVDPRAVAMARENARHNGVGGLLGIVRARGMNARLRAGGPFDLVLANILVGPVQRLAQPLAACVAPRARVILSGLLPAHANSVLFAYAAQNFVLERRIVLDGWVTLVMVKPGSRK
jgi:ribosomal protein L11 methyltransferase